MKFLLIILLSLYDISTKAQNYIPCNIIPHQVNKNIYFEINLDSLVVVDVFVFDSGIKKISLIKGNVTDTVFNIGYPHDDYKSCYSAML